MEDGLIVDTTNPKFMLLNLPNPPLRNIYREYAGGFGTTGTISCETLLPAYLLYGASALKNAGCEYEVLDAQAMNYDSSQVVDAVKRSAADVLISWPSLPSLYDDLAVLKEIKKENPELLVIALGTVCNVMPEKVFIKNGTGVDLVVRGWHPHYNLLSNLATILKNNATKPFFKKESVTKNLFLERKALSKEIGDVIYNKIGGVYYQKEGEIVQSPLEPYPEELNHLAFDVYYQLPLDRYMGEFEHIDGSTIPCIPLTTHLKIASFPLFTYLFRFHAL